MYSSTVTIVAGPGQHQGAEFEMDVFEFLQMMPPATRSAWVSSNVEAADRAVFFRDYVAHIEAEYVSGPEFLSALRAVRVLMAAEIARVEEEITSRNNAANAPVAEFVGFLALSDESDSDDENLSG